VIKLLALGLVAAVAAAAAVLETPDQGPPDDCVTSFREGVTGHPGALLVNGDGGIWYSQVREDQISRIDLETKRVRDFKLPPMSGPRAMTLDEDKSIFWVAGIFDRIIRFDTKTGKARFFTEGITPGSVPHGIVRASDGNVYFTEQVGPRFGKLDPRRGRVTEISEGVEPHTLHGLAADPNGDYLWSTRQGADELIRFNIETQKFDKRVHLGRDAGPHDVIVGPDEKTLWIALQHSSRLGAYDLDTGELRSWDTPLDPQDTPDTQPTPKLQDLAVGPDEKSIWITTFGGNRVFKFDIEDEELSEPVCGIQPGGSSLGVAVAQDGKLWFASALSARLMRVNREEE
jgi:streptogramin lyase